MAQNIIIVDDEADIRELVKDIITDEGYNCYTASDGSQAIKLISERRPSVIILDIWLEGSELDGLGVLEYIRSKLPSVPVIMISGHGTIDMAVSAIKMGAYDYIEKPFTEEKLVITVKRAIQAYNLNYENYELRRRFKSNYELIGSSAIMNQVRNQIDKVAVSSSRVMLIGEVGTGKEIVARMIHNKSKRSGESFIIFRPANYDQDKAITELFGEQNVEIAKAKRACLLERAHQGTLFIDEIANLSPKTQMMLLKFLQSNQLQKADDKKVELDVRIISATRYNLSQICEANNFNKELFHRLNVININLPNLSEHKDDIVVLCESFIKQISESMSLSYKKISEGAIAELQLMEWKGNVRQLRNTIEQIYINSHIKDDKIIDKHHITYRTTNPLAESLDIFGIHESIMSLPLREAREVFERQYLTSQMQRFSGNISRTSNFVGMERSALHRKLKSLNIISAQSEDKLTNSKEEEMA